MLARSSAKSSDETEEDEAEADEEDPFVAGLDVENDCPDEAVEKEDDDCNGAPFDDVDHCVSSAGGIIGVMLAALPRPPSTFPPTPPPAPPLLLPPLELVPCGCSSGELEDGMAAAVAAAVGAGREGFSRSLLDEVSIAVRASLKA